MEKFVSLFCLIKDYFGLCVCLWGGHRRGSQFSRHPDLRWGAIPLSTIGKQWHKGGADAAQLNQIRSVVWCFNV